MTTTVPAAPRPPHRPVERTTHGDTVVDPYEWMREKENPEVIAHLEAENAYADARTAHLTDLRGQLVEEFKSHTQETDLSVPVRRGDWWYIVRTTEGHDYPAYTRVKDSDTLPRTSGGVPDIQPGTLLDGEEVLLDAQAEAEGKEFYSLGDFRPSPRHDLLAFAEDVTGGERYTVRIKDLASGEIIDDAVTEVGYGLAFSPDQEWLFYARVNDAWRQHQIWRHRIGADPATDELVYEETDEHFGTCFEVSGDHSTLMLYSQSSTTSEWWMLDLSDPTGPLRPTAGRRHGVTYHLEHAGDHLLVVHNDGCVGFALAAAHLDNPAEWTPLLQPAKGERFEAITAFAGAAALSLRSGGLPTVRVFQRTDAAVEDLTAVWDLASARDLGHGGELDAVELGENRNWEQTTLRYELTSLLTPLTIAEVPLTGGEPTILRRSPVPNYDPSLYVEKRLWATAPDGTQVPISLAARKEVQADGSNPGYLYGYGSYEVSVDPSFVPTRLSLLDRGVVIAIAHIRGGGDMGREWYEQGRLLHKKNTFSDFVACAQYLIDEGWVAQGRLSAEGRSAGGLLMGAVANLAPQTFRAIMAGVPFVDALTTILDPSLPLTVGEWEEWGNPVESEEVYRYMKEYTPYENIRAEEYPAIFASTSLNDIRVFYVEPAKWIARLRETVTSDQNERPIVFRCEMVAGHGGRSGRYAKWEQRADELAWLLDQIGATELI